MSTKKPVILIADDDPQLLRLMARNLQMEGYEVITTSDGQQALEQLEEKPIDLALLDVMMPKMDGFTVCSRVREFSSVPIIMVTARGQDADKVRGLDLGADDSLAKPFGIEELLAQNAGRILTQDRLLEQVWGPHYLGESHLLQVNINRLRHKMEAAPPRRAPS